MILASRFPSRASTCAVIAVALAALLLLTGDSWAAPSGTRGTGPYRAGRVLVGYGPDVSAAQRRAIERAAGARLAVAGRRPGRVTSASSTAERLVSASETLTVPDARVSTVVDFLRRQPGVRYAEPDYLMTESATSDDPGFGVQWGFSNTGQLVNDSPGAPGTSGTPGSDEHVTPAWTLTTGSRSVVVAEVDSGVDYRHPDLAANIWTNDGTVGGCPAGTHGYNVLLSTCDPMDDDTQYGGHGTHVAGILGAVGDNGVGVTGVNWTTSILPVKWLNSAGDGSTSQLLTALDWVFKAKQAGVNVRVVNDSATFKGTAYSQALSDEIDLLAANDILFVTAAGNTGDNNDDPTVGRYPCRYGRANEICVTASDQQDRLPSWANYGQSTVDLAAPGDQIYSTLRNRAYGYISGGSMASPQVAGAAALILSRGYQSATALKADILDHVDPISALAGRVRTGGRLDVCKAMPGCPDTTPPSIGITTPQPGAHFAQGQAVASQFTCTDEQGGSGTSECLGPASVDTATPGTKTFTVSTSDRAGNSNTVSVTYVVDPPASGGSSGGAQPPPSAETGSATTGGGTRPPSGAAPAPATAPPSNFGAPAPAPATSDAVAGARSLLRQAGLARSVLDIAGRILRFGRLSNPSGFVQRVTERIILVVPGRTRSSRPRRIDLGWGTLVLGPHASGQVVLKTSRRVLRLAAGFKRLRARIDITVVPSVGAPQRQSGTVLIPVRSRERR